MLLSAAGRPVSAEKTAPSTQAAIANPNAMPIPSWNGAVITSREELPSGQVGGMRRGHVRQHLGPSSCCIGL